MNNDITYNDIIDILSSNGVDMDYVKIELTELPKEKKVLKSLPKNSLNNIINKIDKMLSKNQNNINSVVQIYTDGSCLENDSKHPGTFALVVVFNNKIIFEYSNHNYITTNNEMELSALIIASQIGHAIGMQLKLRTLIHSDSQYSVNTLFSTWNGESNRHLQDIFEDMDINRSLVKCEWVKAHDGNILNDYADKLCEIEYNQIKGYYKTRNK